MPDGAPCSNNSFSYHIGESSSVPLSGYSVSINGQTTVFQGSVINAISLRWAQNSGVLKKKPPKLGTATDPCLGYKPRIYSQDSYQGYTTRIYSEDTHQGQSYCVCSKPQKKKPWGSAPKKDHHIKHCNRSI